MGLFDFLRRPTARTPPQPALEIPLFPLNTVLFPGGIQRLKIFEQRYLDMAAHCLRQRSPFGICLIASGQETGPAAKPHAIGTLAEIVEADMPQLGILHLTVRGTRRFRLLNHAAQADQLLVGQAEMLAEPEATPFPENRQRLLPVLQRVLKDMGEAQFPLPHHLEEATWVGYRLVEILPVQGLAKQKLLELDDPLVRLEILERYLDQRGVLG